VKEKKMANKKFWLVILAMVLVFEMTVVGCDDGSTNDEIDATLNGTWVGPYGETTIKNGSYEYITYSGDFVERGTYILDGNIITFTQTFPSDLVYSAVYYPNEKKYVFEDGLGLTYTRK
jgi:uncharacterized lipoprotein YehR (DUF1307 family)